MRKLTLATAISMALFSGGAKALGLGNIELNSALNQPLDAEIELLSVREGETDGMIVTLASQEAFLRAGLDRPFMLTQLRFNVASRADGTPYVRVSSNKPVVEPFLNFLIEVDWPRGRLVREYTVLLDPPVFMTQQAESTRITAESPSTSAANAQVEGGVPVQIEREPVPEVAAEPQASSPTAVEPIAKPEPIAAAEPQPSATAAVQPVAEASLFPRIDPNAAKAPKLGSQPAPAPSTAASTERRASEYGPVQPGQTLWNIANDVRPGDTSVEQMMLALLRANQGAFINDNINLLRRGAILRVPDAAEVSQLTQRQAITRVREQNALWSAYRDGQQTGAAPVPVVQESSGEVATAELSEPQPAEPVQSETAEPVEELRIVAQEDVAKAVAEANAAKEAEAAAMGEADVARQQLVLNQEQLESVRLERNELQSRVQDMEETVSKMERLITLRENELAALQAQLAEMEQQAAAEPAVAEVPPVEGGKPAVAEPEPTETEQTAPVAVPAAEAVSETVTPTQPVQPEPVVAPQPEPTEPVSGDNQQSIFERLLANPNLLLGGGAAAVLLLLLAFLMIRRRLADSDDDELSVESKTSPADADEIMPVVDDTEQLSRDSELVEDIADELGPESEPVVAEDTFDTAPEIKPEVAAAPEPEFEPEAVEELPKDDTVAEADVYLAYGLYGQAEDLLKLAIDENPGKLEYRLKLLEAYYSQKNAPAFVAAAGELQSRVDERASPVWNRAVAMGREIAPAEPMFASAEGVNEAAVDAIRASFNESDVGEAVNDELDLDRTQIIDEEQLDALKSAAVGATLEDDELEKTGTFAPMGSEVDGLEAEFSLDDVDLGIDDETLAAAEAEIEAAQGTAEEPLSDELEDAFSFDLEDEPEEISEDTMAMASEDDVTATLLDGNGEATMVLDEHDATIAMDDGDDATALLDVDDLPDMAVLDEIDLEGDETEFDLEREFGLSSDEFDATRMLDGEEDITEVGAESLLEDLEDVDVTVVDESALAEMLDETMHLDGDLDATVAMLSADDTTGIDTGALESLNIEDGDEVDTMLDLAKAYIDMGDSESAASALSEIISVGNGKQQQEAKELLEQIA